MPGFYDVRARVVECGNCGAPLAGQGEGDVVCEYCGVRSRILARPHDGRQAPSPADEVARLGRLKGQLEHPITGHPYDLAAFPSGLSLAGLSAASAQDLAVLERAWPAAKAAAPGGIEPQRSLVWLVLHIARLLEAAGQPERARAKLETSLDHLPDPGHRLLVRTELAVNALGRGELDAAAAWLDECDPAPEVIELDSAYRHARARLCLARGDPSGALASVGAEPDQIPFSRGLAAEAALVRIHVYEQAGQGDKAGALWRRAEASCGKRVLDVARSENLAPRTRLAPLKARARELRGKLDAAKSGSALLARSVLLAPFVGLALALLATVEGCTTKIGPLGGTTALLVCPAVCDGCREPMSYAFWSSSSGGDSSPHHAVFCDGPALEPSSFGAADRVHRREELWKQEVPGGALTLFGVSYLLLLPVAAPIALLLSLRRRLRAAKGAGEVEAELRAAEAELSAAGAAGGVSALRSRLWVVALAVFFAALVTEGSCVGVGLGLMTQ